MSTPRAPIDVKRIASIRSVAADPGMWSAIDGRRDTLIDLLLVLDRQSASWREATERADAAEAKAAEFAWAEMLTGQSCTDPEHPDWFVDSEHNHRCPWCALADRDQEIARLTAELDALRREPAAERGGRLTREDVALLHEWSARHMRGIQGPLATAVAAMLADWDDVQHCISWGVDSVQEAKFLTHVRAQEERASADRDYLASALVEARAALEEESQRHVELSTHNAQLTADLARMTSIVQGAEAWLSDTAYVGATLDTGVQGLVHDLSLQTERAAQARAQRDQARRGVLRLAGRTDALQAELTQAHQRIAWLTSTIRLLVDLKDGPRDNLYRASKDLAWQRARNAIAVAPEQENDADGSCDSGEAPASAPPGHVPSAGRGPSTSEAARKAAYRAINGALERQLGRGDRGVATTRILDELARAGIRLARAEQVES